MAIRTKRVYEAPSPDDGYRVLVDRLWPRGLTKERAAADVWLRDVGPSTALRTWYGHEVARWPEFRERYRAELASGAAFEELRAIASEHETVTLLYGAKDEGHNQAVVLAELLSASSRP